MKEAAVAPFLALYDQHTLLFHNVLKDISEQDALQRLDTPANHLSWIAGSLVQTRYVLAGFAGITGMKQTSDDLFSNFKGIQADAAYPPLAEYIKDWDAVSPALRDAFAAMSDEQWNAPDPFKMDGDKYTFFDSVTFCIDRESYCIGQIGLWRRLLGYEPMKYT